MDAIPCSQCERNKTVLTCGCCAQSVCKSCARFLDSDAFAFAAEVPAEFKHGTFCNPCFMERVAPALADYESVLEAAKNVNVYFKTQGKETRLVRRKEKPVKIGECPDRDEVILRLAFAAAAGGFDSVVDIELKSEKLRNHAYQKLVWRGTGVPANSKGRVVTNDKSIWHNPN